MGMSGFRYSLALLLTQLSTQLLRLLVELLYTTHTHISVHTVWNHKFSLTSIFIISSIFLGHFVGHLLLMLCSLILFMMIVLHQLMKMKTAHIKCMVIGYSYLKTRVVKMDVAGDVLVHQPARMLDGKVVMLSDRRIGGHACRIQKRAANPHRLPPPNRTVRLLAHLLDPAGPLDACLRLHVANIRSPRQVAVLSQGHAEPEQVCTDWETTTLSTPHTGARVRAHATPTKEVRLAFCCYCNSVILHCRRPSSGQGVGFCCAGTL